MQDKAIKFPPLPNLSMELGHRAAFENYALDTMRMNPIVIDLGDSGVLTGADIYGTVSIKAVRIGQVNRCVIHGSSSVTVEAPAYGFRLTDGRPFDLEAAKRGDPIVASDGRNAIFVAHDPGAAPVYRVVARLEGDSQPHFFCEMGLPTEASGVNAYLLMALPTPKQSFSSCTFFRDRR